mgnify:FL=1
MDNFQSDYAKRLRPMPTPQGGEIVNVRMQVAVTAALALNDIIEFGELPVDCVPVDFVLDSSDIDTGGSPSVTLSVGVANAGKTDLDTSADSGSAVWLSASTIGQAGGMARPTTRAMFIATPRQPDPNSGSASGAQLRMIAAKVAAAGATPAAGTVSLSLSYRAAHYGA